MQPALCGEATHEVPVKHGWHHQTCSAAAAAFIHRFVHSTVRWVSEVYCWPHWLCLACRLWRSVNKQAIIVVVNLYLSEFPVPRIQQ